MMTMQKSVFVWEEGPAGEEGMNRRIAEGFRAMTTVCTML